jgi:hypothetical protein
MKLLKSFILILSLGIALASMSMVSGEALAFYHKDKPAQTITAVSGGKVVIHSPEDGATVSGDSLKVSFEIADKGKRGDHVHVFLNGKLLKPVYGKSHTIKGLEKGEHTIEVKLASKNHIILGPKAAVLVTVK